MDNPVALTRFHSSDNFFTPWTHKQKFKKDIELRQVDMSRLEFTIPPKSTVFIGIGLNTHFTGGFQQARIKIGDKEQNLTTNDNEQMNIKMSGLMRYTGHYDIKL